MAGNHLPVIRLVISVKAARFDPAFVDYVADDQRRLQRLAFALAGGREDADDLVQETLLRVARAWRRIDQRGPHGYATVVMCRLARRWRVRVPTVRLDDATGVGRDPYPAVDDNLLLRAEIRNLPPRQRAVIALRYLCDLTEAQTAETLGCSVGTVKSQTAKALHRLGTRLGRSGSNSRSSRR